MAPHLPGRVAERLVTVLERDPVHAVAERLHDLALELDLLFFSFSHSSPYGAARRPPSLVEAPANRAYAAERSASTSRFTARRSSACASIWRTRSRVSPSLRPISSSDFGSSSPSSP